VSSWIALGTVLAFGCVVLVGALGYYFRLAFVDAFDLLTTLDLRRRGQWGLVIAALLPVPILVFAVDPTLPIPRFFTAFALATILSPAFFPPLRTKPGNESLAERVLWSARQLVANSITAKIVGIVSWIMAITLLRSYWSVGLFIIGATLLFGKYFKGMKNALGSVSDDATRVSVAEFYHGIALRGFFALPFVGVYCWILVQTAHLTVWDWNAYAGVVLGVLMTSLGLENLPASLITHLREILRRT
jgi:hypothetical protein